MLPDDAVALPAIISELEFPLLTVALKGDSSPPDLRHQIDHSPYLDLVDASRAEVVVEACSQGLRLRHGDAARELVSPDVTGTRNVRWVMDALEKIARWKAIADLANSGDSLASQVRMTVLRWLDSPSDPGADSPAGEPRTEPFSGEDGAIHLPYKNADEPGRFTVRIENDSSAPLYYALFGLSEAFAIRMIEDASGRLPARGRIWVRGMEGIPGNVPDEFHDRGITQRRDILLLLVSDQEASFALVQQDPIYEEDNRWRGESRGLQDLLAWRKYRELGGGDRKGRWAAKSETIISERPPKELEQSLGSDTKRGRSYRGDFILEGDVRLVTPDELHTSARLLSTSEAVDRLGAFLEPPLLPGVKTYPLALAGGWGSDGGLSVLELSGGDLSTVTASAPLKISAKPDLPDGEVPVVFAFDGHEHHRVESPGTRGFPLEIPRLPQPQDGDHLWLLFRSAKSMGAVGR
jgi:hypothetical protein